MITPKCFGVGPSKTGTKTLRSVLRILGYKTISFEPELMKDLSRGSYSKALAVARDFDGFECWPWSLLYRELDSAFPGSKFILTTRLDSATWFESLCRHAKKTGPTIYRKVAYGYVDPWEDEQAHLTIYENHLKEVTEHFKGRPDQLLRVCWERGDGWAEVCSFLGRPVPNLPFPHENRDGELVPLFLKGSGFDVTL